jgi:D-glycero-alpha-D-manno-heptose 1-phosphate guanylyltransferase
MNPGNGGSAVILAGGFGTRLQGVLANLPKPMAPAAGYPFVEWIARALCGSGFREIALSTGYLAEKVSEHFREDRIPGARIVCVPETEPLGTAGGFLNAAAGSGFAPESWLVCNGDSLVIAPLEQMASALDDDGVDAAVLALWQEEASRYGSLEIGPDGRLVRFLEKRPGASWINAGIYMFRASLLDSFPAKRPLSFETDVFPALLAQGWAIQVVRVQGDFLDIGLPESLAEAEGFIHRNLAFWK